MAYVEKTPPKAETSETIKWKFLVRDQTIKGTIGKPVSASTNKVESFTSWRQDVSGDYAVRTCVGSRFLLRPRSEEVKPQEGIGTIVTAVSCLQVASKWLAVPKGSTSPSRDRVAHLLRNPPWILERCIERESEVLVVLRNCMFKMNEGVESMGILGCV